MDMAKSRENSLLEGQESEVLCTLRVGTGEASFRVGQGREPGKIFISTSVEFNGAKFDFPHNMELDESALKILNGNHDLLWLAIYGLVAFRSEETGHFDFAVRADS